VPVAADVENINTLFVARSEDDCLACQEDCDFCSGKTPSCLKVVLTGITNLNCDYCGCYNTTFYLTRNAEDPCRWDGRIGQCEWCGTIGNGVLRATIFKRDSDCILAFDLNPGSVYPGKSHAHWEKNFGTDPSECLDWTGETLSLIYEYQSDCTFPEETTPPTGFCMVSAMHGHACPDKPYDDICRYCSGCGDISEEIQMVISGVGNGDCETCGDVNETLIVPRTDHVCSCRYKFCTTYIAGVCADYGQIIFSRIGDTVAISCARVYTPEGCPVITYQGAASFPYPLACTNISGLEIPITLVSPEGQCDITSAKFTLTAL